MFGPPRRKGILIILIIFIIFYARIKKIVKIIKISSSCSCGTQDHRILNNKNNEYKLIKTSRFYLYYIIILIISEPQIKKIIKQLQAADFNYFN